jgi:hypothetical protein
MLYATLLFYDWWRGGLIRCSLDNHAQNDATIRMNVMKIPVGLVPAVREMIAKYKAA